MICTPQRTGFIHQHYEFNKKYCQYVPIHFQLTSNLHIRTGQIPDRSKPVLHWNLLIIHAQCEPWCRLKRPVFKKDGPSAEARRRQKKACTGGQTRCLLHRELFGTPPHCYYMTQTNDKSVCQRRRNLTMWAALQLRLLIREWGDGTFQFAICPKSLQAYASYYALALAAVHSNVGARCTLQFTICPKSLQAYALALAAVHSNEGARCTRKQAFSYRVLLQLD